MVEKDRSQRKLISADKSKERIIQFLRTPTTLNFEFRQRIICHISLHIPNLNQNYTFIEPLQLNAVFVINNKISMISKETDI